MGVWFRQVKIDKDWNNTGVLELDDMPELGSCVLGVRARFSKDLLTVFQLAVKNSSVWGLFLCWESIGETFWFVLIAINNFRI
jgi:hypothetical protein